MDILGTAKEAMAIVNTIIPLSRGGLWIICMTAFFCYLFHRAHKDPNNPVRWEHLIVDIETNRCSPYKLGFLIGMAVSTWVIVNLATDNKLTWDMFSGYLVFLLGGAGWAKTLQTKENILINKSQTEHILTPNAESKH